ncbi:MAG: AEC family transporter [Epsilonproteobacteria bacterium]|nr:AEC family transporter [Campylobacterota bacterium]
MQNILVIVISFVAGLLLRFVNLKGFNLAKFLNIAIVYVSLPSLILLQIPTLEISHKALIPVAMAWVMTAVTASLILVLSKVYSFKPKETGSLLLVGVLGNTSFLGVPLIELFYGKDYTVYALLYDQLGSFIILATYGSVVIAYYGEDAKVDIKHIIRKVIAFPPFVSLVVAFALRGVQYPETVLYLLKILSSTLIPFALISVGYRLRFSVPLDERKPLYSAIFVKTVFAPLVAIALCLMFSDFDTVAKVSVLEAGMGPMITAAIMANLAGLSPRLTNAVTGYGILFSFVTLPIFYLIIDRL